MPIGLGISLFGHDKIFLLLAQSLFNKQNTHTHTRHEREHTIMWCVWGANDCVGHGPVANTQQPLGSNSNSNSGRNDPTASLSDKTTCIANWNSFSLSFSLVFISLFAFFWLLFLFYFWLTRKMKMFNGKNKILTFLSQANVIQFVLLVRKLK